MSDLLTWLASLPVRDRDAAIEEHLGIARCAPLSTSPGEHLIGYYPSGVSAIVQAFSEICFTREDVFVDLGSGLGKVVILAALLTGVTARGIELQPALVERARECAARLGVDVCFTVGDVREAYLEDGTVFFLYAPFTGLALSAVLDRLFIVARRRTIVVCALGLDLDRVGWLARRDRDAFWLSVYDSRVAGASARLEPVTVTVDPVADAIAFERVGPEERVEEPKSR